MKNHPNLKPYPFEFAAQLPVPNALNFNSVSAQKCIAFGIVFLTLGVAMHEPISFEDKFCFGTIEI